MHMTSVFISEHGQLHVAIQYSILTTIALSQLIQLRWMDGTCIITEMYCVLPVASSVEFSGVPSI